MANIKFTNFARSKLTVGIASGATAIAITGASGALFPTLTGAQYFYATIENALLQREIVKVTARTGDSLTVVRGQDGTTAVAWNAGDTIALRFTAAAITESIAGALLALNNLSDIASAGTARTNLGLGTFADKAVAQSFTAAQRGTPVALTDATSIATDLALGNNFSVTLAGNRTLAAPTNIVAGQSGAIIITQDATGSRTLAYASTWKFAAGTAPSLTVTANAVDVLVYYVESGTRITAKLIGDLK